MLRIGICDDNDRDMELINSYCRQYFKESSEEAAIWGFCSGNEVLRKPDLDILFLDIEMPEASGLDVKKHFQMRALDVRLVFCTSHGEMYEEAYGKNVFGFLTKPVTYESFEKKMDEVMQDWRMQKAVITYRTELGIAAVPVQDIIYVKPAGRYSKIRTTRDKKEIFCIKSYGEWKEELDRYGFADSHRSWFVNLSHISRFDDGILLNNGSRVPLSRRMKKEFEKTYCDFIADKAR